VWTDEFGDEVVDLITEAVELEKITPTRRVLTKYLAWVPSSSPSTSNTLPTGSGRLDLPEQYGTDNPFPWMSE